jgi:HK97 family phage major capsid protein
VKYAHRRRPVFSLAAITAAVASIIFGGPSGRAAQFGRVDLGDPKLNDALDAIEKSVGDFAAKAKGELETIGKVSKETQDAITKLGQTQLEQATRLLQLEQKGGGQQDDTQPSVESMGDQVVKSERFKSWCEGQLQKVRFELKGVLGNAAQQDARTVQKNTVLTSNVVVPADRRDGVLPGAFRQFTIENFLNARTTDSNAVEYTRELLWTNNAAEVAEGAQKPESSITFELINMPVTTVAHWIKISRQLSKDAPALVAYINQRMRYGVDKRVEDQLVSGNGTAPNIAGLLKTGNYTPHGYTSAVLGAVNQRLRLIRKVIGDLAAADYPADYIIMNAQDWADIELMVDTQNNYLIGDPQGRIEPRLWGLPVLATNAMPVDTFLVLNRMAAAVYNREGTVVEMSESDADNFTKNLITIRAERRLMLAVEIPAAIRGGDITPA